MDTTSEEMVTADQEARARDHRHVWHTWSPLTEDRADPMYTHGDGYRLWDTNGRQYLDASSLTSSCGYGHPHVAEAVGRQARRLHHVDISTASHEPAGLLAQRIAAHLPDSLAKTLFVNSGSEGIEAAMLIAAAHATHIGEPRSRIVTFARGYQGATMVSRAMSALPRARHPLPAPLPVTRVELPLPPRELRDPAALPRLLAAFEDALGDTDADGPPLAVVVEPLLNVGGGVILPAGFLRGLRELCDAAGALLVLDEVFTGFGRTGRMFACLHERVTPDILVSSKGLAGGYVPVAAVTVHERVHRTFGQDPVIGGLRYGHTTSAHPVGCAAGLATLDVLEEPGRLAAVRTLGTRLLNLLAPLAGTGPVTDVRGLGLVSVLETPAPPVAARLRNAARERGLLLRQQGEAVAAVPPLIVDESGIEEIAEGITRTVAADVATG